jgi:hypothetical protein
MWQSLDLYARTPAEPPFNQVDCLRYRAGDRIGSVARYRQPTGRRFLGPLPAGSFSWNPIVGRGQPVTYLESKIFTKAANNPAIFALDKS